MAFFGWLRREQKASAVSGMIPSGQAVARWSPRNFAAFAEEGYKRNVVAFQAINRVAEAVSAARWTVFRGDKELTDSPLIDLLKRPNPMQSGPEFLRSVVSYLLLAGDSYIERVDVRGEPRELYTLRPDRMSVKPGRGGIPAGYEYKIGGDAYSWENDENGFGPVRHLKLWNPLDDWYGMSPMEAAAYGVDQHNDAMSWMQALLQNSARPSGALMVEGGGSLGDETYARLKAQMEDMYQGSRNAGRPMLLEGGLKWVGMGLSPDDMNSEGTKNSAARDICLAFGVPPQLLGIPGDNTYSNYEQARLAFWEDSVIPLIDYLAAELSAWLTGPDSDIEIRVDLDQIPAIADKRRALWEMADKSTDLTIDERRALKGYEPLGDPRGKLLPGELLRSGEMQTKEFLADLAYGR